MNPYFLETEMRLRPAELRREIERSRRLADLVAALLRTLYPSRHPRTDRLDVIGAAEPRPA